MLFSLLIFTEFGFNFGDRLLLSCFFISFNFIFTSWIVWFIWLLFRLFQQSSGSTNVIDTGRRLITGRPVYSTHNWTIQCNLTMNSIAKYQMIQEACPLSALLSFTQQYAYSISLHTNCRSERNSMSILDVSSEVVTGYLNHFSASKFMFLISKLMFLISKLMFFISKLMRLSVKVGFIFIYFRMILSKATFTSYPTFPIPMSAVTPEKMLR